MMQIHVETLAGTIVTLNVEPSNSIEDVIERIAAKEGLPPDNQHVTFEGKPLENNRTLADCNVQQGATLKMVLHLRASKHQP